MEERKEFTCKKELRSSLLSRRSAVSDRTAREARAAEYLMPLLHGNVMIYASIGSELSTDAIINNLVMSKNIAVYAPYTVDGVITPRRIKGYAKPNGMGNLREEYYISEDKPVHIDVCVTPLVGFNDFGYRIGYGRGCYDRYLKENDVLAVGLAFDLQRVHFTPEPHDVPLDCCVTESGVVYFGTHARNIG